MKYCRRIKIFVLFLEIQMNMAVILWPGALCSESQIVYAAETERKGQEMIPCRKACETIGRTVLRVWKQRTRLRSRDR